MIQKLFSSLITFTATLLVAPVADAQCGGGGARMRAPEPRHRVAVEQWERPAADAEMQESGNAKPFDDTDKEKEKGKNKVFYRAEGCGMSYESAKAKKLNYRCSMDGSRLVPTLKVGWGTVSFSTNPWPAGKGKTTVEVRPLDKDGKAVKDAKVSLTLSMPGMKMEGDDQVITLKADKDGLYTAPATLSMSGKWLAAVTLKRGEKAEKAEKAKFEFEAAASKPEHPEHPKGSEHPEHPNN